MSFCEVVKVRYEAVYELSREQAGYESKRLSRSKWLRVEGILAT
jgi:hypothetical protein